MYWHMVQSPVRSQFQIILAEGFEYTPRYALTVYNILKFGWPNFSDVPDDVLERTGIWLHKAKIRKMEMEEVNNADKNEEQDGTVDRASAT